MPKYNIIYTSPNDVPYLWNGITLDKLDYTDRSVLTFGSSSFSDEELDDAIKGSKIVAKQMFPGDEELKVNTLEVKVTDGSL